jgi:hypothetical protein
MGWTAAPPIPGAGGDVAATAGALGAPDTVAVGGKKS